MTSSSTTSRAGTTDSVPSRRTVACGASTMARESRVCFARSSDTIPMTALIIMTPPKMPSRRSPNSSTMTDAATMIALNSVKTFSRMIDVTERDVWSFTRLTAPRATRSATSAALRPHSSIVSLSVLIGTLLVHRAANQRRDHGDHQSHNNDSQRHGHRNLRRPLDSSTAVDKRQGVGM